MNSNPFLKSLFLLFAIVFVLLGGLYYFNQPLGNTASATILLPPLSRLDLPPKTMDGITATVESYYADASRLIFMVRITGIEEMYFIDNISLMDQSNRFVNTSYGLTFPENTQTSILIDMATESPLESKDFQGVFSFTVISPEDETISVDFAFNMDFPIHPARALNPGISYSANGIQILLDRIVVTPASTQVYLCYVKPSEADWMIGNNTRLKSGNQESGLLSYSLLFDSNFDDIGKGIEANWNPPVQDGRCVKIGFPIGAESHQSMILTIPSLEQSVPEVIPDDEIAAAREKLLPQGIDIEWEVVSFSGGGGGSGPVYNKLPEGMTELEAYQLFMEALGYIHQGPWVFTVDINP